MEGRKFSHKEKFSLKFEFRKCLSNISGVLWSLVVGIDLLVQRQLTELLQEKLLPISWQLVQQLLGVGQVGAWRSRQRLQARLWLRSKLRLGGRLRL